ncbi:class I SAM-dependent methyltransferase [Dyella terrae]|nr:class I SAM-dependent methyltransferase [Dyella terrae]
MDIERKLNTTVISRSYGRCVVNGVSSVCECGRASTSRFRLFCAAGRLCLATKGARRGTHRENRLSRMIPGGRMIRADAMRGVLGDTPARDYSQKLKQFNAFARPELCRAMDDLGLQAGMRVLDAGCGTGDALAWLGARIQPGGVAMGVDLSLAHVEAARETVGDPTSVIQADLLSMPFRRESFDLIWSVNVVHHLSNAVDAMQVFKDLLRPGGRMAMGQSSFLADMYFAWDARLERATNEAVRQYYRDRYEVSERELTSVRAIVGLMRQTGWRNVRAHSYLIERVSPLHRDDEVYLAETIFRQSWGERLKPYLSPEDYEALSQLSDPAHPKFALRRPDFHFLQTLSFVTGER